MESGLCARPNSAASVTLRARSHFDADTYHPQPRAFGTRPRFSEARFEAPTGPPVRGVVKWFNPEKGFGFVELFDGSGDAFLHGSVLSQSGNNAVQPGETLEVRVGPGHKGPHVTEVLSVDASTAVPNASQRSRFRAETSNGASTEKAVEETRTVNGSMLREATVSSLWPTAGKSVCPHVRSRKIWADGPQRGATRRRRCRWRSERSRSRESSPDLKLSRYRRHKVRFGSGERGTIASADAVLAGRISILHSGFFRVPWHHARCRE